MEDNFFCDCYQNSEMNSTYVAMHINSCNRRKQSDKSFLVYTDGQYEIKHQRDLSLIS